MKTSLVIMAAGIGSRCGGGIKQLSPVGLNGEIIMDYSIHDALEAGFDKIIFIIRKDIEKDFREVIGNRIEKICEKKGVEVCYAFQDPDDLPVGHVKPEGRKKPWGTGQAVLSCKKFIDGPFAVINADDYYGKDAYKLVYNFLSANTAPRSYCMAGFILKNTLSDNGGVTRGVCELDENNCLVDIAETHDIVKTKEGAESNGRSVDIESTVSMNFWGFMPDYMDILDLGFVKFLNNIDDDMKSEFLIPVHIGELLEEKRVSVKVLKSKDKWFGVTYKEDREMVMKSIDELIKKGVYEKNLYNG